LEWGKNPRPNPVATGCNDILTPGEMGAISRDFGPCAKKCTCFCDHHLENFVEDTDSK